MVKWSFSGLKDFINCPRQYNEVKNLKRYTKKVTEQMLYGTEVHKALEDYVRDGTPLVKNYERFKPSLDALLEINGTRYPEHKMALTREYVPCGFDADEYWVRGIVDLLIVDGPDAYIIDYKTGSARYPDTKQLKLMALFTFSHFPEVETVKAGLLFVVYDVFITEEYKRDQIAELVSCFAPDLQRLTTASNMNVWNPKPSGLCGWCPVTECEFHKKRY